MRTVKVDFPSLFFVVSTGLIVLASVVALRFNQSKYMLEALSPGILTSGFTEQQAESFQSESSENVSQVAALQNQPNKRKLDLVTFVLWFIFGIVAYYLCYGFYATFIHPFSEDVSEGRYIHANKRSLIEKRMLWIIALALTIMLAYGTYFVYRTIVLTYYTASIYNPGLINGLMLLGSIIITSLLVSFVRLGCRVVIRAY